MRHPAASENSLKIHPQFIGRNYLEGGYVGRGEVGRPLTLGKDHYKIRHFQAKNIAGVGWDEGAGKLSDSATRSSRERSFRFGATWSTGTSTYWTMEQ
jgi:hypothetical protein